ncbi:hypothetical protein FEM03_16815 [Phragmitibacter flavus]|uniref:Rhamnogalacturonase A/B/Epimerase-like pectate lyase domain-containing protein n=1 Tax=Phragmitibacter flavus TaxID=2576071 RepID=A0A5R8KDG2_9BACT|nr:glycosyl hydrolase family 28-related protein [Phragmitibacter flavus]TLD69619.1 hypothetical protein FEM03_16815 [Phragmitibacter flavus]
MSSPALDHIIAEAEQDPEGPLQRILPRSRPQRQRITLRFIVLLFALLCWKPWPLLATEFVRETFSGLYAGDTVPSAKWNNVGSSFTVQDSPPHRAFGTSSLFGRIEGANARISTVASIPTTGLTVISFTFREPTAPSGQALIFGLGKSNEINSVHAGLAFTLNNGVFATGSNTTGPSSTYPLDVPRKITVVFNRNASSINYEFQGLQTLASNQADVWISQTGSTAIPTKIGTYTSTANTAEVNQFVLRTFSAPPGNIVDFDNLSIRDTIAAPAPLLSSLYPQNWTPPQNPTHNFQTGAFLQDFSHAGYRAGNEDPPTITGPEWIVTNPPFNADPTGVTDSTLAIQSAINTAEAAGGGIVKLPAGTYRIRPQGTNNYALRIDAPNIVLRGDGPATTRLLNDLTEMRNKQVILIQGASQAAFTSNTTTATTLITTDLPGPTTQLPVANAALFSPGDWITVRADTTDAWITEHGINNWLGYGSSLGGFAYRRKVVAVDPVNHIVTIDIPTRYSLTTRDNARLLLAAHSGLNEIGLENFSIGMLERTGTGWAEEDYNSETNASWHTHSSFAITFQRTRDSWMTNVHSYRPEQNTTQTHILSNGVHLTDSCRITLADCHFQNAQYGGGGGNGYLYRISNASDNLLIRCRGTFSRHAFVFSQMRCSGNVFHRCIDSTTGRQVADGNAARQTTSGTGSDHHMHFSHSNLIDTCIADSSFFTAAYRPFGSPPLHEVTASHSVFWNTEGTGSSGGAVVRTEQSRMGYAIGTRGTRNTISRPTGGGSRMAPADWVEAAGQGDHLEPFSLYEDQLQRRIGPLYLTPLAQWRHTHFGQNFEKPDLAGSTADPDQDHRPNVIEFALNSHPLNSQSDPRTTIHPIEIEGVIHHSFTLPVRNGATFDEGSGNLVSNSIDGITYTIQSSIDLQNWTTIQVVEITPTPTNNFSPLDDGWSYRTFRTTLSPATTTRLFYRAMVTALPE